MCANSLVPSLQNFPAGFSSFIGWQDFRFRSRRLGGVRITASHEVREYLWETVCDRVHAGKNVGKDFRCRLIALTNGQIRAQVRCVSLLLTLACTFEQQLRDAKLPLVEKVVNKKLV